MSRYICGETDYACGCCEQGPACPGHRVKVYIDCSTDNYIVEVDGKTTDTFDENYLHAILDCLRKEK